MATYIPQISRCLSYHAPICRPHRLLHGSCVRWKKICTNYVTWQTPMFVEIQPHMSPTRVQVQCYSKVFTFNTDLNVLRKLNAKESPNQIVCNVVPVGVIVPENKDGQNMKIVIVPLDVKHLDKNALETTLTALKQLRIHAHEIDEFTDKMLDDYRKESEAGEQQEQQDKQRTTLDEVNLLKILNQNVNAFGSQVNKIDHYQEKHRSTFATLNSLEQSYQADVSPMTPNPVTIPSTPNTVPVNPNSVPNQVPQTQPTVLPLGDPNHKQISADDPAGNLNLANSDLVTIDVSNSLNEHLDKMAISSMKLSFEMNMTDVRDAILLGDESIKPSPTLGDDAMVYFETKVESDPSSQPLKTVPLQFNALINGTVQVDTDKLTKEQLTEENLASYQDSVTSIAANICTTALQKNFLKELSSAVPNPVPEQDMDSLPQPWFSYLNAQPAMNHQHKRAVIHDKDGCKHPILKPKKKCPKPCKHLDDPCKEDKCTPPKKAKKPKTEKTVQITASASKGKNPCGKGGSSKAKKDPCGKGGKGGKKADPCAKFKSKGGGKGKGKKDPCAQFKSKGKGGGKKSDPCGKGKGKGKGKGDPCAKFKKGGGGKCKKFSTIASPVTKFYHPNSLFKPNRTVCTCMQCSSKYLNSPRLPRFKIYSTLVRRRYSGKPSNTQLRFWGLNIKRSYGKRDSEDVQTKCNALASKKRSRKDKKARTSLRTDCDKTQECKDINFVVKCKNVRFPRKKCRKDEVHRDPPRVPKKPKKKPAPICLAYKKKNKKSPGASL